MRLFQRPTRVISSPARALGLFLLAAGCLAMGAAQRLPTTVAVYPTPPELEASPDYQVLAEGQKLFVQKTPAFSMAAFGFGGKVEVVVEAKRPIQHPVIRPLSLGIQPLVEGNRLRFTIRRPCHLAVEIDGDLRRPLLVFADGPEPNVPKPGTPNVRYFAGGRVYDVGTLVLSNQQTVYLAGGAVVRGCIRAEGVSGARILGPGILDGSLRTTQTKMVWLRGCTNIVLDGPIVLGSYGWTIVPQFSEDIVVRNVKILSWRDNDDGLDPDSSRRVSVEHCFFRTKDDCVAVKAHGLYDPNGRQLSDAGAERLSTRDVWIRECVFWSAEAGHALTVGFAIQAPIRNVLFENCDIIKKEKGWAMSVDNHDLSTAENIRFENIRVEEQCDKLIALKVAFSEYSRDCPLAYFRNNDQRKPARGEEWERVTAEKRSGKRGTIRNVSFKNIQIAGPRLPGSVIMGYSPAEEIQDVTFENIRLEGRVLHSAPEANLQVRNASNVRFSN